MMAGFERVVRRAMDLDGEFVTPGAWAEVMARCDMVLQGADPRIRHAAAVGALVTPDPDPGSGLVARLGLDKSDGRVGAVEVAELRRVSLVVTHAAARVAEDGPDRLLLAAVERSLLQRSSTAGGIEAGPLVWSRGVAAAAPGLTGASALVIARAQYSLLTLGAEALERVDVLDGVGHSRLLEAVDASREQWRVAREAWRELVPRRPAPMNPLHRGLVALQVSMHGASDEDRLMGLLTTGMGGNLIAAAAVTPAAWRPGSGLVAAAVLLEARSDLSRVVEPRTPSQEPEEIAVQTPATGPGREPELRQPSGHQVAEAPKGRVWEVDPVPLSNTERLAELARERDAGLAAVLAGRTGSDEVVIAGERARATIAAAAVPIAGFWSQRVFQEQRDDFVAAASLRLMELANTWDPDRARWSTYAYGYIGFFVTDFRRQQARVRETPSDTFHAMAGAEVRKVAGSSPARPEDHAILNDEWVRVRKLVDELPDRLRPVAERRWGLDGEKPRPLREVGESIGLSSSGTYYRERLAVDELQARYTVSQTPPPPVTLGQLADALTQDPDRQARLRKDQPTSPRGLEQRGPVR